MQIFLDTTDTAVLKDLAATGLVDGVTTNPSLIAKSGRPMLEVIAEICGLVEGPVSAEAVAGDVKTMLAEGRSYLGVADHLTLFPGLAIFVTVLAFNLLGDGLRDALDQKLG